jgi:hypothetical protein
LHSPNGGVFSHAVYLQERWKNRHAGGGDKPWYLPGRMNLYAAYAAMQSPSCFGYVWR